MKPIPKWLMIPPAVALLLVLGPLTMRGPGAVAAPATGDATPAEAEAPGTLLPKTPDFWQLGSALAGVLLLGTVAVLGLRRLRGGATPARGQKAKVVTLRQTLRLGQRQALHAIEFDDRILLVGESERGLALIESGRLPDTLGDEADANHRAAELLESALVAAEDGATPKNLVIPRPEQPSRALPKRPAVVARQGTPSPSLNDFRALLQKAGR
ncbi:MAG: flagellar biosynthetic protein FliO [Planctomycetes bacterium]|nr:flagellar biosynthetic protein FliO [Planctomycetota bacterium]